MRHFVGHPLEPLFERAAESLTTALSPASLEAYRTTLRSFLRYLGEQHREVCRLEQSCNLSYLVSIHSGKSLHSTCLFHHH